MSDTACVVGHSGQCLSFPCALYILIDQVYHQTCQHNLNRRTKRVKFIKHTVDYYRFQRVVCIGLYLGSGKDYNWRWG